MNEFHSQLESKYKPRWLAALLREAINDHAVVVLTGARQVGKSTLLLKLFLDEYPETMAGVLVHAGSEIKMLHEKIIAIPWILLAGL